ncbi:DUF885 family protein [Rhodanobacter sp. AS-Z3]|uniref:DUF885 domain-containing protein n=1 Tax=Rhodanobacter sp. AS-Z3 TaxID=3031330 RepID=UPI00247A6BFE|nr:DUF885 family protein [Rhodanobacter sp. AS-Z3]WEN15033.1 DUF885 family protein [Rhodanobacter sp. AS-Z3]
MPRNVTLSTLIGCLGIPCITTTMADANAGFRELSAHEWAWRQAQFAGADDEDTRALPADHLPRVDPATQAMRERVWAALLEQLNEIPLDALSDEEIVNYQVYRQQIETLLAEQRLCSWQMPLTGDTSFWGNLLFSARQPLRDVADGQRYLAWLGDIARYFDEQMANMREGLARGFSVPRISLTGRDHSLAEVAAASAEESVFYTPFRQLPASVSVHQHAALCDAALAAIRTVVIPAHAKLLGFMREVYMVQARDSIAASALPDGAAYYRTQIRKYTTLEIGPDEIHALGLREVAQLRTQMLECVSDAGFIGDLAAFIDCLRNDPSFYASRADELLKQAAWIANRVNGKLGHFFGRLPRQRFVIEAVPDDLAPFYTSGRGGPGYYLVNTWDLPSRPLYSLTALTLHEAAPGHAMQMPLAAEQEGLPAFRRECHLSAYDEGWALYSERLGVEMGLYDTPYDRFGYLSYQMWRACRLVVDTGLHHLGWSREQARACLRENTALSEHEVCTEVDRYIAWPAQALSYYLGQMAFVDARARAELALGERFDLRAFHDVVLALGSVPLPVLQQQVDRFIDHQRNHCPR